MNDYPSVATSTLLIIDDLPFRRACIVNLLRPYISAMGFSLSSSAALEPSVGLQNGVAILVLGHEATATERVKETAAYLLAHAPGMRLAVLSTMHQTPDLVRAALRAGASAYLTADMDPALVLRALDLIGAGGAFCSPSALMESCDGQANSHSVQNDNERNGCENATARQQEIMRCLRDGLPNKLIARKMQISEATVKIHVRRIMRRMGVNNRTQVALRVANADLDAARQAV
jgi:DNA-binding NarL/FixJ family response regulator